jgi:transposase
MLGGMSIRLVNVDRQTPMLLPVDLRDWVPADHIVHFILEAVSRLPKERFHYNWRGTGSAQYPPEVMLALLIYCYCTGRFHSRAIEAATYSDLIVRYLCGNTHPDHDTICAFRRNNKKLFEEAFVSVLSMAQQTGCMKRVGTVAVDGTKVAANASKHAAVSYKRAGEQLELLRAEVAKLVAKAEGADAKGLEEGLSLPEEIQRREDRIERLEQARRIIRERYEKERQEKQTAYEAKVARRDAQRQAGKKPRGRSPKPPPSEPPGHKQYNFTDPESQIIKDGDGFTQAHNAQAAVETDSLLIVGQRVSGNPNDKKELKPTLESIVPGCGPPQAVLADNGYYSEDGVEAVEKDDGPTAYVAVEKTRHGVKVEDLERRQDPAPPPTGGSTTEKMRHRLATKRGRELYGLRKQTVEPVFGIIKEIMGFRRFSMRGKWKAELEWTLVCTAYNIRRLHNLGGAHALVAIPVSPGG